MTEQHDGNIIPFRRREEKKVETLLDRQWDGTGEGEVQINLLDFAMQMTDDSGNVLAESVLTDQFGGVKGHELFERKKELDRIREELYKRNQTKPEQEDPPPHGLHLI